MRLLLLRFFMLAHRQSLTAILFAAVAFASLIMACNKVPLLAPTGSVITLLPLSSTASLNSQVGIVATVIENGAAAAGSGISGATTRAAAGTPVQNGTLVTFTTTVGQIQPSEATTRNGQVTVNLVTGSGSGTAHITAYSGGASTSVDLKVGTAAAKTINVSATPQGLGASGGTSQIVANVEDDGGSPIGGVPVTFTTDKGSVAPATAATDASGNATVTLTTSGTAKVTATAGAISGNTTVSVNVRGLASFTVSSTGQTPSVGTPVSFTVTPTPPTNTTPGSNLTNVRVTFGDGSSRDLGAITTATNVSHVYNSAGSFTATATSFDATGESGSLSTDVTVGGLQVFLVATPNPTTVGTPTTFTVQGTGSAVVDHYLWTFDDGSGQQTTSGPQLQHTFTSRGLKNIRVDVIGINGAVIGTAPYQVSVQ
jgi:adhesin/invasin